MKLAIVSGGFDPVHVGHIELLQKAREKADSLFVIVNNDAFLERNKAKANLKRIRTTLKPTGKDGKTLLPAS